MTEEHHWVGIREPLKLEKLSKKKLLRIIAQAYQAVGVLSYMCDVSEHPDVVRLLDVLAYGRSVMDEHELLPWPRQAEGLPLWHGDKQLSDTKIVQGGEVTTVFRDGEREENPILFSEEIVDVRRFDGRQIVQIVGFTSLFWLLTGLLVLHFTVAGR